MSIKIYWGKLLELQKLRVDNRFLHVEEAGVKKREG